ncbi:MAG TPA: glycosyltransferase family 2 protein [Phycisphaerae bacterium]|nr:glycosyltransferase family 2 protein [Phycisphaerae bacterium]
MRVSLIIPCYNEEATVGAVLERVSSLEISGASKELIVVDDGSTDRTGQIIDAFKFPAGLAALIHHAPINMGKGASLRVGMALATGDVIAFQDADLELNPAELPKLIACVLSGQADIVFGSRFLAGANGNVPGVTRLANKFLTALTNLLFRANLTDMETAYKVFNRNVCDHLRLTSFGFDIEPEITAKMLRLKFTIQEMAIRYYPRAVCDGKKIRMSDGLEAIWTLLRVRFLPRSMCGWSSDTRGARPQIRPRRAFGVVNVY